MIAKVINVFYDTNCYPFKDKTLQTRFPIVGNSFAGASNVTDIKFYTDNIGGDQLTWVAKSHLPNGKVGSQILSTSTDSQGFYAILHLTKFYTQAKGDLYISLEGYNAGDTELVYDDETELYSVSGNPVIQGTGNIKLSVLYTTPIEIVEDIEGIDSDSVLGYLSTKLDKNSRKYIKFVDDVDDINDDEYSQYLLSGDTIFTYNQHEFYELSTENDELVATPIELGYVRKKPTQRNTMYGVNGSGVDTNYPINTLALANTIPIRDSGGQLEVALTPTRNASATSKQYVDRFGYSFVASIDNSTYVMTLALKDKNGNTLSTQTIDLPLETMVISGSYDDYNEKIVLTLKNGETIDIPVADLISGLASEDYVNNTFVTKDTAQIITGLKTIAGGLWFEQIYGGSYEPTVAQYYDKIRSAGIGLVRTSNGRLFAISINELGTNTFRISHLEMTPRGTYGVGTGFVSNPNYSLDIYLRTAQNEEYFDKNATGNQNIAGHVAFNGGIISSSNFETSDTLEEAYAKLGNHNGYFYCSLGGLQYLIFLTKVDNTYSIVKLSQNGYLSYGSGLSGDTIIYSATTQRVYYTKSENDALLNAKEDVSNKVTTLSSSSTDEQYVSAKCTYDMQQRLINLVKGKNNGYILSYSDTIASVKASVSGTSSYRFGVFNANTGEVDDKTEELLNGDYDNISTVSNSLFNTSDGSFIFAFNNQSLIFTHYQDFKYVLVNNVGSLIKNGDEIYIKEANVPDRWVYATSYAMICYAEEGKIDLSGYVPTSRKIAGKNLTADISAQTLTDSLVLMNTTTDIDDVMED